MKLFFGLGPGDIVGDIKRVRQKSGESGETSITFSEQVFDYVVANRFEAMMTSHHPRRDALTVGAVRLLNQPKPWPGRGGIAFHLSQVFYGIMLAFRAKRFGADIAIIDGGSTHSFMLVLFKLVGIRVAVNFHNVRWPIGFEPAGFVGRSIRALDSWFFRRMADAALGCSPECGRQARTDGADQLPYFDWRGQYSADDFNPTPCDRADYGFQIIFAGRVEHGKGVFDLADIGVALAACCPRPVTIQVCGDGGALQPLRDQVAARGLDSLIVVRGRLERAELLEAYRQADVVIVPTRGSFCEGMPLVCAEAMLAGRPVVTSRLSNALPVLGSAVAEAEPENIESYVAALARLAQDNVYYEKLRAACKPASAQFLDPSQGYDAAIDRLIRSLTAER